jgi:hypothetical protein
MNGEDPRPQQPFDLEPLAPSTPRAEPAAVPSGAPRAAPTVARAPRPAGGEVEVDTRTVAERQGKAVERVAGVRPPPPRWPLEALGYPLRGHGAALLAGTTAAVFALDLLGWPEALRFLSWMLKTPALLFVVRWQLDLVGHSAAGRDEPTGWGHAIDVHKEDVKGFARYLLWAFVSALPASLLWLLQEYLGWVKGMGAWIVALFVVGSAWMSVVALGTALAEPRLKRPWVTVLWIFWFPLTCLTGSLGWWALGVAEATVLKSHDVSPWAAVPSGLVLRAASIYALMVSARVLGVLGRRWDPERMGPA